MSDMDDMFLEPFRKLLGDISTPTNVRRADEGQLDLAIWQAIGDSGFLDAMTPESSGGFGLTLAQLFPLVAATGECALPVPFAETMVARALLAERGAQAPADAVIVIGHGPRAVPLGNAASHVLITDGDMLRLVPSTAQNDPFGVGAGVPTAGTKPVIEVAAAGADLLVVAAGITATKMAGAMSRILEMSLGFVNDRQQFGRSLGKFQAVQHQLAIMAEQVASALVAARIGMSGNGFDPLRVALAKTRASEAAHQATAIAHAMHGAIGATEEYDLQLYTRRLKQWQIAFGSESYWAAKLGAARLTDTKSDTTADFVRLYLQDGELV